VQKSALSGTCQAMGIETEEDVQVLASYFLKHRAATREADAGSKTVRLGF